MFDAFRAFRFSADRLTGLSGRDRFCAAVDRALAGGTRTAVLIADLNGFGAVNDAFGHVAGDHVLVAFAGLLRRCVPSGAAVARTGGDEFGVVMPGLAFGEQAYDVAGRLAAATGPLVVDGRLVPVACAVGVAVTLPGQLTHDQLVHRATLAMRQAKRNGPDTRWAAWQESFEHHADPDSPLAAAA